MSKRMAGDYVIDFVLADPIDEVQRITNRLGVDCRDRATWMAADVRKLPTLVLKPGGGGTLSSHWGVLG